MLSSWCLLGLCSGRDKLVAALQLHETRPHLTCAALPVISAKVLQESSQCTLNSYQNGCVFVGEEETDLDLGELIKKGEVAWLSAEEMMKASEAAHSGTCSHPPLPHTATLRAELSRRTAYRLSV